MLNRPSNGLITRVVVLVGALLAISAMLLLSTNSQDVVLAHDPPDTTFHDQADPENDQLMHVHYAENGTEPVTTFTSSDPERARIHWDVMGTDADDFTIAGGVLRFKELPNFEMPTDRTHTAGDDANVDPGNVLDNNEYVIMVRATEMRASSYTGPAKSTMTRVTVLVTNEDEDGTADINWLLPEVATVIMASLTDPDGGTGVAGADYQWYRSSVQNPDPTDDSNWTEIETTGEAAAYTPVDVDEGRYLRVVATYEDGHSADGTTDDKEAQAVSANPVRENITDADNGSPDFVEGATDERDIDEDAAIGDAVGDPVTASEPNAAQVDILTYTITGGADAALFTVDKTNGQLMCERPSWTTRKEARMGPWGRTAMTRRPPMGNTWLSLRPPTRAANLDDYHGDHHGQRRQ